MMNSRPHTVGYHALCCTLFAVVSLMASCANNAPNAADAAATVRIIVGFNSAAIHPEDPAVVRAIQEKLGMDLSFVRKLSDHAVVYSGKWHSDETALQQRLKTLKTIPYIQYAEPDRRRHILDSGKHYDQD